MSSHSINPRIDRIAVFSFGVGILVLVIVLAVFFPEPTSFQYLVFRSAMALAAAGIAVYLPGSIHVNYGKSIRAGGAIAIFVLIWLFNPASLISKPQHDSAGANVEQVISGIVVDQITNEGIGHASIALAGRTETYVTEDTGNFRIDLPAETKGRIRLRVSKDGFATLDRSVEPPVENLVLQLRKQ